jgi:glycosyltransferase involved in cell wall biosynthesis
MTISTYFAGRVIQVTDALDRFDAVSNQVRELDVLLKQAGLQTAIATRWAHPDCENERIDLENLVLKDDDVVVLHYYGYSEGCDDWISSIYCTKVLLYHNITPHVFFAYDRRMFHFCERGRTQLAEIIPHFHQFWAASDFNLQELIALGAKAGNAIVLPIVVRAPSTSNQRVRPYNGQWVFVGRVAPNKGITELVKYFSKKRRENGALAKRLVIVGSADSNDGYCKDVLSAIESSEYPESILLTGKISDEERDEILSKSDIYISLSEHEGFGVPLVEAPLHNIPVLALNRAATAETLGNVGVFDTIERLDNFLNLIADDEKAYLSLLRDQQKNAERFNRESVFQILVHALSKIIPDKSHYRTVSVVVCTYNRCDYLDRCLEYLTYQSNDNFEVVVVNGPSTDGTENVLEKYRGRIKTARNLERNLSKSRNIGIDCASGDIVAFIDDDAIPFDDWVDTIISEYNRRPLTTAGLGGPAYYAGSLWFQAEDNGIDKDCQVKVGIDSREIGRDGWLRYNTGTNATFSRNALEQIDGFDEQYDYFLDESELCVRLQKNQSFLITYIPDLYVRHEFAQSHNRQGKLNYNWYTICKNTAYFIASYSGLTGEALESYISRRFADERIAPLDEAVHSGNMSSEARDRHVDAIWAGMRQGLDDYRSWPRTRAIKARSSDFLRFRVRTDRLAVGRDIKKLHICIVSKEAPPFSGIGGVGTLYYHLASELLLMGHYISLVVPSVEDRIHRQGRLTVYFTKPLSFEMPPLDPGFIGNVEWSLTVLSKLAKVHRDRPIDVVDGALWDTETLSFALLDADLRPALVVRLVTPYAISAEINGWSPDPAQLRLFMEAERNLIKNADAVIPISRSIARTLVERYDVEQDERWSTGHCGIAYWPAFDVNEGYGEFPELGTALGSSLEDAKLVVFVGRLERRKGIDLILAAAKEILTADLKAVLIIAGRDPEDWAARFANELPIDLAQRVSFLGEISDATREKLLSHAYCLLFPSRYESFGLVPLEAFVHGVPVIACSAGAVPEVVTDGVGILIDPETPGELAKATIKLLGNGDLRSRMSTHARERVRRLSSRNSALHAMEVYARVINRQRV